MYSHLFFQRDKPELLENLHRKTNIQGQLQSQLLRSSYSSRSELLELNNSASKRQTTQRQVVKKLMNSNKRQCEVITSRSDSTTTTSNMTPGSFNGATNISWDNTTDDDSDSFAFSRNGDSLTSVNLESSLDKLISKTDSYYHIRSVDLSSLDRIEVNGKSRLSTNGCNSTSDVSDSDTEQYKQDTVCNIKFFESTDDKSGCDVSFDLQCDQICTKSILNQIISCPEVLAVVAFFFEKDPQSLRIYSQVVDLLKSRHDVCTAIDQYMEVITPDRLSLVKLFHPWQIKKHRKLSLSQQSSLESLKNDSNDDSSNETSPSVTDNQNSDCLSQKFSMSRKVAILRSFISFTLFAIGDIISQLEIDLKNSCFLKYSAVISHMSQQLELVANLWWELASDALI